MSLSCPSTRQYSSVKKNAPSVHNLYTCLNTLSKTSPLSVSRSGAQMANTVCVSYKAKQWSTAHYLHYLQMTDGQIVAVTQATEHLQC